MHDVRELPLNRSEVFYTATVLPMLACARGLDGLRPLLVEAGAARDAVATGQPLQLMTEYDHVKATTSNGDDWPTRPAAAAVPDLVVLADGDLPTLVAIEAKMFHRPSPGAIAEQLADQRGVLEAIATDLGGDFDLVQALLVPQAFAASVKHVDGATKLTWEDVLALYQDADPHWHRVLQEALQAYETMKSKTTKIFDAKVTGAELEGLDHPWRWVGTRNGVPGLQALAGTDWRARDFEVRYAKPPTHNPNWMPLKTFRTILGLDDTAPANTGVQPVPLLPATVAMSWQIVLDLFDRMPFNSPAVTAYTLAGAETMYDLLAVASPVCSGKQIAINRPGSIHLDEQSGEGALIPWGDYIADPAATTARLREWLCAPDEAPAHVAGDDRRRFTLQVLAVLDLWRAHSWRLPFVTDEPRDMFGYHYSILVGDDGPFRISEFGGVRFPDGNVRNLWKEAGHDPAVGSALLLGWLGTAMAAPDTSPPNLAYKRRYDIDSTPALVALPDADLPETWHAWRTTGDTAEEIGAERFVVDFPRELRGRPSWPDNVTIEATDHTQ